MPWIYRFQKSLIPLNINICVVLVCYLLFYSPWIKLMHSQSKQFLNLFRDLRDKRCATALVYVTDVVFPALDSNTCSVLVLLDYPKVFNMTNHEVLLAILHYVPYKYSSRFSPNGTQQAKIQNNLFLFRIVTQGFPQGSTLGQFCFVSVTITFMLMTVLLFRAIRSWFVFTTVKF